MAMCLGSPAELMATYISPMLPVYLRKETGRIVPPSVFAVPSIGSCCRGLTSRKLHNRQPRTAPIPLEVKSLVPDRKHPKRVRCSARHRTPDQVSPEKDWVPLHVPPNMMEAIEAYLEYDKPKVGWCLLCNSPIDSEDDFISETDTHNCAEGLRFHQGCN